MRMLADIMKRSEINAAFQAASACFEKHHWVLPPDPLWDITDFGMGEFKTLGLTLVNLAEEPEYCEKLMFAYEGQVTPMHAHKQKKEDIICRAGKLALTLFPDVPAECEEGLPFEVQINGRMQTVKAGDTVTLEAGERITLVPGVYHEFWAAAPDTILGEVSTANDDANDNFFLNPEIGRFSAIVEDEPAAVKLLNE